MEPERIECTRAEFTAQFGLVPSRDVIGVCFVSADGTTLLCEYLFTDEWDLGKPEAAVWVNPDKHSLGWYIPDKARADIADLERLLTL